MKNIFKLLCITLFLNLSFPLQAQINFIAIDYLSFGRREPVSLGSIFSALGTASVFVNPANVALVTDNRISIGGSISDIGDGRVISWIAPNMSISSAMHRVNISDTLEIYHRKELTQFCFGISTYDLGLTDDNFALAVGFAFKRQFDRLPQNYAADAGGNAVSLDVGFLLSWRPLTFEFTVTDLTGPQIQDSEFTYPRGFSFCTRYTTKSGFMIALQGISGNTYSGSDFGINLAARQSFLDHRLTSRIQLTSFFDGAQATMQNISGSVSYRPALIRRELAFLQDFEFSYALSFLALPKNVGTHLIVLTKYF
jgi:hypothetical protein